MLEIRRKEMFTQAEKILKKHLVGPTEAYSIGIFCYPDDVLITKHCEQDLEHLVESNQLLGYLISV